MSGPTIARTPLDTLRNCNGYYSCPKGPDGTRLGPLVGYTGKYEGPDGKKLQWVGDVYANFAMAEVYPHVVDFFARNLANAVKEAVGVANIDVVCGAPFGGYTLADALGRALGTKAIKAEKKVTALATATSRETSEVEFRRHDVLPGERVVIVEDVCNNFTTTDELITKIRMRGGQVVAIACFLNRSLAVNDVYVYVPRPEPAAGPPELKIPIISCVRQPIHEWRQDNSEVAEDVAKGNIVLKPKDEWPRLMKAMADHSQ